MLKDRITDLHQTLLELQREFDAYVESSPSAEEACGLLLDLNLVKSEMRVVYESFAFGVGKVMGEASNIMLPNGEVEKSYNTKRTGWQHKDLANVVAEKLMQRAIDMDTGEVMVNQHDLITQLLNYVQPSYWKVGELSKLGLNADNYCIAGETKVSIIVRKGGTESE